MDEDKLIKHELTDPQPDPITGALAKAIAQAVSEVLLQKGDSLNKTEIVNVPAVKIANHPETQKITGDVKILEKVLVEILNQPEIQKVTGRVTADVNFPKIQEIIGEVVAEVAFPEVQKIVGEVVAKVTFPEIQKVMGEMMVANLPVGRGVTPNSKTADPSTYVPVRLTNGRQFYEVWQTLSNNIANSRVTPLGVPPHDYVSVLYPDTVTEQYTFKSGGASGKVVAMVTVGYTSSAKTSVSYVQKV